MIKMLKKELEEKCKELEKFEKRCSQLERVIKEIQWMALRYSHGRMSCAVGIYNDAIKKAQDLGIEFKPDKDGLILAKDAMFDKEWFEAKKDKNSQPK